MNPYETERFLSEYLLFHYGSESEILPYTFGPRDALNFPRRCAQLCRDAGISSKELRALDLGCAVGRASFELARFCAEVVGIDRSANFIQAARALKEHGRLSFKKVEEGSLTVPVEARVSEEIDRARVTFEEGDACRLREDLGLFDLVLAANLIDRLPQPGIFLQKFSSLVRSGGIAVITSPYSWMEEFTPASQWLGGMELDGKKRFTRDALKQSLEPAFSLLAVRDVPFLIREHARKFQWNVAEATVWKRR